MQAKMILQHSFTKALEQMCRCC